MKATKKNARCRTSLSANVLALHRRLKENVINKLYSVTAVLNQDEDVVD